MEQYNSLHHVASALRMSVSHLLFVLLALLQQGVVPGIEDLLPEDSNSVFSNYIFSASSWTAEGMIFTAPQFHPIQTLHRSNFI